ncbi:hypothetical protein CASFOL_019038 [Castilleja foliolosa]|uniref:Uncharacterized protein n=1 Tax=Castilleja foliolosa TaxID=1961234 RepID=A0ABD3D628_9LAMI
MATTISGGFELGSYKSVADWMVAELRQLQWIGDSGISIGGGGNLELGLVGN